MDYRSQSVHFKFLRDAWRLLDFGHVLQEKLKWRLQVGGQCGCSKSFFSNDIGLPQLIPDCSCFGNDQFFCSFLKVYRLLLVMYSKMEFTFKLQLLDKATFLTTAAFVDQAVVENMQTLTILKVSVEKIGRKSILVFEYGKTVSPSQTVGQKSRGVGCFGRYTFVGTQD